MASYIYEGSPACVRDNVDVVVGVGNGEAVPIRDLHAAEAAFAQCRQVLKIEPTRGANEIRAKMYAKNL